MVENQNIPSLKHINFFPGQQLTARDLTELQRFHRELRWLHHRSLHGWGIANGFEVSGETGESVVTLAPGFGLDCIGREIILTDSRTKTIPAVAAGPDGKEASYYLVASFQREAGQKIVERRPGICAPAGTVRLTEEPAIAWLTTDKLQAGLDLILARIWIKNCRLSRPVSLAGRRYVTPWQQPYMAAGEVGAPVWKKIPQANLLSMVTATVDTSAAHFRVTPCYLANVVGNRSLGNGTVLTCLPLVEHPTPRRFTLAVIFKTPLQNSLELDALLDQWYVVWMGMES